MRKKIAVFTGAGISAESGVETFRGSGEALWENHSIEDVATPQGWAKNPELVTGFYNARRKQLETVEPNGAHKALALLEGKHEVNIITQNVDDLHERGGATKVHKLHGDLKTVRSCANPEEKYDWGYKAVNLEEDRGKSNAKLRPDIVWFGEWPNRTSVETGYESIGECDILIIVGTSFNITYTWDMVSMVNPEAEVYYIDPEPADITDSVPNVKYIRETAVKGVTELVEEIMSR